MLPVGILKGFYGLLVLAIGFLHLGPRVGELFIVLLFCRLELLLQLLARALGPLFEICVMLVQALIFSLNISQHIAHLLELRHQRRAQGGSLVAVAAGLLKLRSRAFYCYLRG